MLGAQAAPGPQLRDLRALAAHRSFQVVRDYVDKGISGASDFRPALNSLMADARRWEAYRAARTSSWTPQWWPVLRAQGASWREIASKLGVGATTARRVFSRLAKRPAEIPEAVL